MLAHSFRILKNESIKTLVSGQSVCYKGGIPTICPCAVISKGAGFPEVPKAFLEGMMKIGSFSPAPVHY